MIKSVFVSIISITRIVYYNIKTIIESLELHEQNIIQNTTSAQKYIQTQTNFRKHPPHSAKQSQKSFDIVPLKKITAMLMNNDFNWLYFTQLSSKSIILFYDLWNGTICWYLLKKMVFVSINRYHWFLKVILFLIFWQN